MSQGNILLLIGIVWPSIVNLALNLEDLIRDSIVVGVGDKKLCVHLQLDSFPTSEKAIAKSRRSEIVKKRQTFPQLKENFMDNLALHMQRLCLATESKYMKSSKVGHRTKACRSQSARQWVR